MVLFTVCFRQEIAFLGRFGPESQNCQFKLKQLQYAELNAVIHFFFFLEWKYLFKPNEVQKHQNSQFNLKFGTCTDSNV